MPHAPNLQAFLNRLDEDHLGYWFDAGRLHVLGDLYFYGKDIPVLPDDLTVQGDLLLMDARATELPSRLVVTKSLDVVRTPLTAVPACLSVGQSVRIEECPLAELPLGFRVARSLNLSPSTIQVLPEGLDVGGYLDLRGTRIARFPQFMRVEGAIHPSACMHDITAFLARHPDPEPIVVPTSHHDRMAVHARIHDFPDLLTVVMSRPPGSLVRVLGASEAGYALEFPGTPDRLLPFDRMPLPA